MVHGLIQGVGFRPFVYRLARSHKLNGYVCNNNHGVEIILEGSSKEIKLFLKALPKYAPKQAHIDNIVSFDMPVQGYKHFQIIKSTTHSNEITNVSPDIAVCNACLDDRNRQRHRLDYAFINCTNCGPRFSIIQDIPYDREKTTMHKFTMCDTCQKEYTTIEDRRFHAQPIACNHCGPHYEAINNGHSTTNYQEIIISSVDLLKQGEIIAIKGLGGFHLACSALNENAVKRLRAVKKRAEKPFAVMFPDMNTLEEYATYNEEEKKLLQSWQRPIVILSLKKPLPATVTNGLNTIGAFLPYMPFHYDLLSRFRQPIILTSGNRADEPICIDNQEARLKLSALTPHFVMHNRDIHNRVDDSVAMVVNNKTRLIRRARGYCPEPVNTLLNVEGILAAGPELANTFAIGKGTQAIPGQHIGDLQDYDTFCFYREAISRFKKLFRFTPSLVVHDLHPDYLSTSYAQNTEGLPLLGVQHHHAHIAACMAEHHLDEKVIGVAFDGTGYGTDGHIWGSEFMLADLEDFERLNHFDYFMLPGGDAAVNHPWRTALSLLYKYYGTSYTKMHLPFLTHIPQASINTVLKALNHHINTTLTASAGRLFDAVAALTGLCLHASYHAQAPMMLESVINPDILDYYPVTLTTPINLKGILDGIINDIHWKEPVSNIATRFHNTMARLIILHVKNIRQKHQINKVVLSGGCFQNAWLLTKLEKELLADKFDVYTPANIPANDGGIALGQLIIAAKRRDSEQKNLKR